MAIDEKLKSIEMFAELSVKQRREVLKLMTHVTVGPGHELIAEGTIGREFIIILDGEATVRRAGRLVARVGPGDFIGELAVIAGVARTATVTADTDMTLSVLNRSEFSSLLDAQPALARKILVGAVKRLHALDPSLVK